MRRHADERLRANLNSDENGDNSNHTVDAPKQGSLKGVPSKGTNDDEALVYERGGDVVEGSGEGEQPCLGVSQSFDHLFLLERLVLHTRLVLPDPEDGLRALLRGEEPGIRRGVWEQEPVKNCGHDRNQAGNNHEPVESTDQLRDLQES